MTNVKLISNIQCPIKHELLGIGHWALICHLFICHGKSSYEFLLSILLLVGGMSSAGAVYADLAATRGVIKPDLHCPTGYATIILCGRCRPAS